MKGQRGERLQAMTAAMEQKSESVGKAGKNLYQTSALPKKKELINQKLINHDSLFCYCFINKIVLTHRNLSLHLFRQT